VQDTNRMMERKEKEQGEEGERSGKLESKRKIDECIELNKGDKDRNKQERRERITEKTGIGWKERKEEGAECTMRRKRKRQSSTCGMNVAKKERKERKEREKH
jgi:hypothetical protein